MAAAAGTDTVKITVNDVDLDVPAAVNGVVGPPGMDILVARAFGRTSSEPTRLQRLPGSFAAVDS